MGVPNFARLFFFSLSAAFELFAHLKNSKNCSLKKYFFSNQIFFSQVKKNFILKV